MIDNQNISEFLEQAIKYDFHILEVATWLDRPLLHFSDIISYTICPSDAFQFYDEDYRLAKVQGYVQQLLKKALPAESGVLFDFFTEVSQPLNLQDSKGCRVHFHGFLYFTKKHSAAYFNAFSRHLITVSSRDDYKIPNSVSGWFFYITKDRSTAELCAFMGNPWHFSERTPLNDKLKIVDEEAAKISHKLLTSYKYLDADITYSKFKKK